VTHSPSTPPFAPTPTPGSTTLALLTLPKAVDIGVAVPARDESSSASTTARLLPARDDKDVGQSKHKSKKSLATPTAARVTMQVTAITEENVQALLGEARHASLDIVEAHPVISALLVEIEARPLITATVVEEEAHRPEAARSAPPPRYPKTSC
jgi:hypothetical protein